MIIYYFTILFLSLSGFCLCKWQKGTNKQTILFLVMTGLYLTILASFRYAIGFDYFSYRTIYYSVSGQPISRILLESKSEFLFYLLCRFLSFLGFSYTGFLIIINLFIHSTAMWFIGRFSRIPWLSIYLYITLQFLAHNMNLLRQSIALSFFLIAYPFLRKRQFSIFAGIMLAGSLFHNSLIFMIPLYFLLPFKQTKKSICIILFAALLLYVCSERIISAAAPWIFKKYAAYQGKYFWQGNGMEYIILPAVYLLLILLFRKQLAKSCKDAAIYINSALYYFIITFFITKHFILERFSVYLFILSILIIPEIVSYYWKTELTAAENNLAVDSGKNLLQQKRGIAVLILFLLFGFLYFLFAAIKGFHHVYPYISLFDRAISSGN